MGLTVRELKLWLGWVVGMGLEYVADGKIHAEQLVYEIMNENSYGILLEIVSENFLG